MRDAYAGNLDDYYKYGLLRCLTGLTPLGKPDVRLGIIWYYNDLVPQRKNPDSGTEYLSSAKREEFRTPDVELYEKLLEIGKNKTRALKLIMQGGILPRDTVFYSEPLPSSRDDGALEAREDWFEEALQVTRSAKLILLDPDTGLENDETIDSEIKNNCCYAEELQAVWGRGQSIVLYQRANRHLKHAQQVKLGLMEIAELLEPTATIEPLYFFKGGHGARTFFVLIQAEHRAQLLPRVEAFRDVWKDHLRSFVAGPRRRTMLLRHRAL